MEWQELLQDLINLVEATAPELWRIAIKQVYVNSLGWGLFALAFVSIVISLLVLTKASYKWQRNDTDWENVWVFFLIAAIILFAMSLLLFYEMIGRLINPEYYAIELLINYVK